MRAGLPRGEAMAFKTFTDFETDYKRSVESEMSRVGMRFMGSLGVKASVAWDIYKNSMKPGLGFHIFGRHVDKEDRWAREGGIDLASKQPGALGQIPHPTHGGRSLSAMEYNFGIVNDSSDGSILMVGSENWNLHVNDAWLMGGVHAYLPFYSASALSSENLFRGDNASTVLGITGREFLGLLLAGYKAERGNAKLGVAMVCKNKAQADRLDFSTYENSVRLIEGARSRRTVIDMAKEAGVDTL